MTLLSRCQNWPITEVKKIQNNSSNMTSALFGRARASKMQPVLPVLKSDRKYICSKALYKTLQGFENRLKYREVMGV